MKIITVMVLAMFVAVVGCSSSASVESTELTEITLDSFSTARFVDIDINNDGSITYDEFDEITKNDGDPAGNTIYAEYDIDGDGIISEKEFSNE